MAMVDRAGGIAGTGEAGQPLASSGMTVLQDAASGGPASPETARLEEKARQCWAFVF